MQGMFRSLWDISWQLPGHGVTDTQARAHIHIHIHIHIHTLCTCEDTRIAPTGFLGLGLSRLNSILVQCSMTLAGRSRLTWRIGLGLQAARGAGSRATREESVCIGTRRNDATDIVAATAVLSGGYGHGRVCLEGLAMYVLESDEVESGVWCCCWSCVAGPPTAGGSFSSHRTGPHRP